jgi:hypothetical protein
VGAFLPATGEVITMLKSLAAAGLVITLASTAYAKPPEVVRQTKVTDGYSSGYLNWTGGIKGMDYLWKVQTHEGKIHICGAGHYTGVQARLQTKDIMRRAFVTLEGKKILRDLRFFKIVPIPASMHLRKPIRSICPGIAPRVSSDRICPRCTASSGDSARHALVQTGRAVLRALVDGVWNTAVVRSPTPAHQ